MSQFAGCVKDRVLVLAHSDHKADGRAHAPPAYFFKTLPSTRTTEYREIRDSSRLSLFATFGDVIFGGIYDQSQFEITLCGAANAIAGVVRFGAIGPRHNHRNCD